jgi:hypothetical protein
MRRQAKKMHLSAMLASLSAWKMREQAKTARV